jgi:flagellar biosynthesis anti-sigma factor FlgM
MQMTGVRKTGSTRGVNFEPTPFRGPRPATAPKPADRAGITEDARELARALEAVRAAPEVRELRIAALRRAIANGSYAPDPHEIARRLMERGGFVFDDDEGERRPG